MPHYRTMLSSDYLCAADLWSEKQERYVEVDAEIVAVKKGEVVGEKGRKKTMPFVTLRSAKASLSKPFGLNATNCKTVSSLSGSEITERWVGVWIRLYVTRTEVGREMIDAIRIRPVSPSPSSSPGTGPGAGE